MSDERCFETRGPVISCGEEGCGGDMVGFVFSPLHAGVSINNRMCDGITHLCLSPEAPERVKYMFFVCEIFHEGDIIVQL